MDQGALVWLVSIVGALAVLAFVVTAVLGFSRGWRDPSTRRVLTLACGLGVVCGVIGVLFAVT